MYILDFPLIYNLLVATYCNGAEHEGNVMIWGIAGPLGSRIVTTAVSVT
jgi:hypothetical protein